LFVSAVLPSLASHWSGSLLQLTRIHLNAKSEIMA
jgi:hypothetical protein